MSPSPQLHLSPVGLAQLRLALAGADFGGAIALTSTLSGHADRSDRGGVRELVDRARGGDGAAFGALYERYVDVIYRYVYYRVGTKPLTEDVVSETFLRALRRIGSFRWQGADFGAWLTTIARNIITDHYKSSRYRLEVPTAELLERPAGNVADAASVVLDREATGRLLAAVRLLPSEQQECIVLRFLQGMSVAETAGVMRRGDGAIKALQYRAIKALAKQLEEGGRP